MKNNSGIVHIILLVSVVTISVLGISYFVYKNKKSETPSTNTPLTSPTPTISPDTSNWKTYSNYIYSIKLPDKYKFDKRQMIEPSHMIFQWSDKNNAPSTHSILIDISYISGDPATMNCKNNNECWNLYERSFSVVGYTEAIAELSNKKQIRGFRSNIDKGVWFLYPISINGKGFVIDIQIRSSTPNVFIPEINQILSTLIFLDQDSENPVITFPVENSKVSSPLRIEGRVPTGWMFEGVFPIKLLDENRNLIAQGRGQESIPGSWQSGNPINFEGKIIFTTDAKSGFLVLENDNPSGLPENSKSYEIPVNF